MKERFISPEMSGHIAQSDNAWGSYQEYVTNLGLKAPRAFFAFSRGVRSEILDRDGYQCVSCGNTDSLEAAHIDHDRDNPNYNHPSNGRCLCSECHLIDHVNRHGRNGVTKRGNGWAIDRLMERSGHTPDDFYG